MIHDEELLFNNVLDALDLPEPDRIIKEQILKIVMFLLVAKEIGVFHTSIPGMLLDDFTDE